MSGKMTSRRFSYKTTDSESGLTVGTGTVELSVDILSHEGLMPVGDALSPQVKAQFMRALGVALLTVGQSVSVELKELG